MGQDVQIGMHALVILERIGVRHEVASDAIGMYYFLDTNVFIQVRLMAGRNIAGPPDGLVGDSQVAENVIIKMIPTENEFMNFSQEFA